MEGNIKKKLWSYFKESEHKIHKELQTNLIAIKYLQTVLFTKIITTILEKKLDGNQPKEQTGFRSKYSTTLSHACHKPREVPRIYHSALHSWITRRHLTQYKPKHNNIIDIIAGTMNKRNVHRNPERYIRTAQ